MMVESAEPVDVFSVQRLLTSSCDWRSHGMANPHSTWDREKVNAYSLAWSKQNRAKIRLATIARQEGLVGTSEPPVECRHCGAMFERTLSQRARRIWKCGKCRNVITRRKSQRLERAAHPLKFRARDTVKRAVKSGRLIPKPCQSCGEVKSHAHHSDYSKPLDVEWLCHPCHELRHHPLGSI